MADEQTGMLLARGYYELLRLRLLRTIAVASPAAGAEIVALVPGGVFWEVIALRATLTTSAAVANRLPVLQLRDTDSRIAYEFPGAAVQAASLAVSYSWSSGYGTSTAVSGQQLPLPAPAPVVLAGGTVRTVTTLLDVADQWSAVVLTVREWSPSQIQQHADWIGRQQLTAELPLEEV